MYLLLSSVSSYSIIKLFFLPIVGSQFLANEAKRKYLLISTQQFATTIHLHQQTSNEPGHLKVFRYTTKSFISFQKNLFRPMAPNRTTYLVLGRFASLGAQREPHRHRTEMLVRTHFYQ